MIRTAYRFMQYDKVKSFGVQIGIVISIFLIGQQAGILSFLTNLMGGFISNSRQDIARIWVVDNITRNVNELGRIDEGLVRVIRSVDGVSNTYPIIVTAASMKFPNGKSAPVVMIGSEPPYFVAGPAPDRIIAGNLMSLAEEQGVSSEYFDRKTLDYPVTRGTGVEINGNSAIVRVQTKNARGFGGSLVFTTLSRARFMTGFPASKVSAVAVSVREGYNVDTVVKNINRSIYGAKAWNAETLRKSTISLITLSTNIGTSIGSLVIFAIISGFFIIGLTLYSSAVDRMKDYGTLKAIGAPNSYITRLILTQAFIFALAGFGLAVLLLEGFRAGVVKGGLIFSFSLAEYAVLFIVTLFISVGSSLFFSIRTINKVEPATVFRG